MKNNRLPLIIGGCVVLLLCCCLGAFVVAYLNKDTFMQTLGLAQSQSQSGTDTGLAPLSGSTGNTPTTSGQATAVPTSPSGGVLPNVGNLFGNALQKAKSATKYRVDFSMVFGGVQNGQYKEAPFVAFTGEIDGSNSHITSNGGLLSSMMTGSETGKVEIIESGGTEYMKGATSLFGAIKLDPNTWYIANQQTASSFAEFAKPDEFSSWTGSGKLTDFQKTRSESVDGQSCDVYLYDMKSIKNAALVGLLGSSQNKNDFDSIDRADINLWLCGDGYVHKYVLDYEGHSSKDATQKGALKMNWHIWDVNNPLIVIQAPAGAKPMPTK